MMQPLDTKLVLRKKRATEGRSNEEVEHYPVPSKVTVRHRSKLAAVEVEESGVPFFLFHFLLSSLVLDFACWTLCFAF